MASSVSTFAVSFERRSVTVLDYQNSLPNLLLCVTREKMLNEAFITAITMNKQQGRKDLRQQWKQDLHATKEIKASKLLSQDKRPAAVHFTCIYSFLPHLLVLEDTECEFLCCLKEPKGFHFQYFYYPVLIKCDLFKY